MNDLGSYFDTVEGGTSSQPVGDYFESTPGGQLTQPAGSYYAPAPAMPINGSPDGLGAVRSFVDVLSDISPLSRELRRVRRRPVAGFGQTQDEVVQPVARQPSTGVLVAGFMLGVAVRGVAGYYVGKALAPSQQAESKYAWWGVPTAIVFGTLGLGVEAAIALRGR